MNDDHVRVVPSRNFDKALHGHLHHLESSIIALIERIAKNPYEPDLVCHCQIMVGDADPTSFAYHSPAGFELYWDVEVEPTKSLFPTGMRVLLTNLRPLETPRSFWLNRPVY